MSETIKQNIVVHRGSSYYQDNGRQSFNNQADRITPVTASDIFDGVFYSSETLRFHRKVHR